MTITVSAGVSSGGLTISSGDPLVVLSGGFVSSSTILSGGSATFSSGSLGEFLTVSKGGVLQGPGAVDGFINVYGSVSGVSNFGSMAVDGSAFDTLVAGQGVEALYAG